MSQSTLYSASIRYEWGGRSSWDTEGGRRSKKTSPRPTGDPWSDIRDERSTVPSTTLSARQQGAYQSRPAASAVSLVDAVLAATGIRPSQAPATQWETERVTPVRKSREVALRRGLTTIIDRAVPLLSEQDERRLVDRLQEVSKGQEDEIWAAVEHFMIGDGATKANIELGAALIIALYDRGRENARSLIAKIVRSRSVEDLDCAVRIISSVEDPWFCRYLKAMLDRDDIPEWLRETIQDTWAELSDS